MNELLKIYIDNVNAVFHPVKAGSEYGDDELQMNEIKFIQEEDESDDETTIKLIKIIASIA